MAIKREIAILRSSDMSDEILWETYAQLVGLLTIDAYAHFVIKEIDSPESLTELLGRVDFVAVADEKIIVANMAKYNLSAPFGGVISLCGREQAAFDLASHITVDNEPCRVLSGNNDEILKLILSE